MNRNELVTRFMGRAAIARQEEQDCKLSDRQRGLWRKKAEEYEAAVSLLSAQPVAVPDMSACFMTAESGGGEYKVVLRFQTLAKMQDAHSAMIHWIAAAQKPEQQVCEGCNGHGMVGGLVGHPDNAGYDSEPCPFCTKPEQQEAPELTGEEIIAAYASGVAEAYARGTESVAHYLGLRAVAEAAVKDVLGGEVEAYAVKHPSGYKSVVWVDDSETLELAKATPYELVPLYGRPQASAAVPEDVVKDAERYRWLKSRMVGVNFDWDDEGMTALAFEMPDSLSFCADCDKNIDAAMLASQPEVKS